MGAPRKYKWEEWFDRPSTVIVRGVDYHCSQSSMSQIVRNNASHRGVRVRIVDIGHALYIQVVERTDEVPHTDPTPVAG